MEKIFFNLDVVEGYPPVYTESLWAERLSSGNYKIKNIPFYAKEVSFNDVISIRVGSEGEFLFHKIVRYSGNNTLRIVFFDENVIKRRLNKLAGLGCSWECMNATFYSVNIPTGPSFKKVIQYLEKAYVREELDYEYGKLDN
ncbi:DUF4265 domain-containing protein [Listeria cossartiae]|uniref:DUF4265 domain-containing protein n=1 Tax=Listeria cossartiae TaxID=2838249 RepID=UPI001E431B1F|nr:DUF4265 domain-containing protein [Listeria cossartiae]MCD2223372.1 DUF4265 domain-containing protein [Listeria cossartiae]MCD2238051.1 DUF4265 domain-containing protein [Listeria cossartiae]